MVSDGGSDPRARLWSLQPGQGPLWGGEKWALGSCLLPSHDESTALPSWGFGTVSSSRGSPSVSALTLQHTASPNPGPYRGLVFLGVTFVYDKSQKNIPFWIFPAHSNLVQTRKCFVSSRAWAEGQGKDSEGINRVSCQGGCCAGTDAQALPVGNEDGA